MKQLSKQKIFTICFPVLAIAIFSSDVNTQAINESQLMDLMQRQQNGIIDESYSQPGNQNLNNQRREIEDESEIEENNQEIDLTEDDIIIPDLNMEAKSLDRIEDYQLERFGYEIFEQFPTNYTTSNTVIPDDYIIGPDDRVKIIIFGTKNPRYTLQVTREGEINIPTIGPIAVSGLTFIEMKAIISQAIEKQIMGVKTSITLDQMKAINVFIVGNALNPGNYVMQSLTTLTNAIFIAGGISEAGSLRNIQLRRQGKLITSLDLYDLFLNGDSSQDSVIKDGDVIFISNLGKTVGIAGEVRRPGIYELKNDEKLDDLIEYSGGINPRANTQKSQIQRIFKNRSFTMIDLDLSQDDTLNEELVDGDLVRIYPILNNFEDVVFVNGLAREQGFYQWKNGLRISDIIKSIDDLLPQTDRNYLLVKREDEETGDLVFYQSNIINVFSDNDSKDNVLLFPRDEIFLFNSDPFMEEVEISSDDFIPVLESGDNDEGLPASFDGYIDSKTELLVIRDNIIEKILKTDFETYEAEGFEKAIVDGQLARDIEIKERQKLGDRKEIIEPLIKKINTQFNKENIIKKININGSIIFPGEYPLSQGMTLRDAINAAGGIGPATYTNEIEVLRLERLGNKYLSKRLIYSLNDIDNVLIESLDSITLKEITYTKKTVKILGEVLFPGEYSMGETETISDLINRAGGFKKLAYQDGAVFLRESIKSDEEIRLEKLSATFRQELLVSSTQTQIGVDQQQLSPEKIDSIVASVTNVKPTGRLVIDLQRILNDAANSPILEDRDILFIPKRSQVISVIGEVRVQSSHLYTESKTFHDYLDDSGGVTDFAEEDGIYIISSSGAIRLSNYTGFFRQGALKPGDTIVVPLVTSQYSGIKAANEISQIIYQIAVATAAISGLNR